MSPGFVTIELQVSLYILYIYRITTHYFEVLRFSIIQLNIIACLAISSSLHALYIVYLILSLEF